MDAVERDQQELYDLLPESSDEARLFRQCHFFVDFELHQQNLAAGIVSSQWLTPIHIKVDRGQAGFRDFLAEQIKRIGNFFSDFRVPHTRAGQDEVENRRKRYIKYSEKAVTLAMTFFVYLGSASSSSTGNTAFRVVAYVASVIAICTDLFSYKISPKQGHAMVYLSSFSLVLTTFFIFISFKKIYSLTVIFVPLIISAILLEHKRVTRVRQQSTDEELDKIFDSAARVLGFESVIAMLITFIKGFKHVAGTCVGFFFFSTLLLAIYLMVLTTVRSNKTLLFRATQLDILLRILLLATVLATCISLLTSKQSS